jgi:hypothetical protein
MSRRSRRGSGRGKSPWLGRVVIGLVLVLVVGVLALVAGVRGYLHGDSFRKLLSAQAGKVLKGEGEFEVFRWQGLQVRTDAFDATGEGSVRRLRAEGIETEIGLGGFGRGVWELRGSHIRKLEAEIDLTKKDRVFSQLPPSARKVPGKKKGWLPDQAELLEAEIGNIVVRMVTPQGPADLAGARLRAVSTGGPMSYRGTLDGGMLQLPWPKLPTVKLGTADLRWQDGTMFVSSLDARMWEQTRLAAGGEWDSRTKRAAFDGAVNDIPCAELLDETWAKRVAGMVDLTFECELAPDSKHARGTIQLTDGMLTALPVLDALAAYADTRRFRVIQLTEARSDWRWRDGVWYFSDLVLASEGLIRLEGGFAVRGEELDGTFRLGLPPGTLARIPGAETEVFLPGERGLMWTTLRITGTLDKPREDLTERLIAAAGGRMFELLPETGEKVIRYSRTLAGEAAPKVIEEGVRVLEQGQGIIRGANGILDGLLGAPRKEEP